MYLLHPCDLRLVKTAAKMRYSNEIQHCLFAAVHECG